MSVHSIVAELRSDRTTGFEALYRTYAERLYAYATTVMRDPSSAADVTHDALINAVTRIDQLRDPGRLEPWLFAITRNECFKALRANSRVVDDQETIDMQATVDDADRALNAEDSQALVREAMGTLSAADRDVLALALRNDLDTAQVADAMGTSPNQVRARLSRARTALTAAVTALLLARDTDSACAGLSTALTGYDGRLTPLLRKRVARHARDCPDCESRGNRRALAYVSGFSVPVVAILPRGFEARAAESVATLSTPGTTPSAPPESGTTHHPSNPLDRSSPMDPGAPTDSLDRFSSSPTHLGAPGTPWIVRTAGVVAAGLALVVGAGLWQRGEIPVADIPPTAALPLAETAGGAPRTMPFEGGPDSTASTAGRRSAGDAENSEGSGSGTGTGGGADTGSGTADGSDARRDGRVSSDEPIGGSSNRGDPGGGDTFDSDSPTVVDGGTAQPDDKPADKQPDTQQPDPTPPDTKQPDSKQPNAAPPDTKQPETKQPDTKQPDTTDPQNQQPAPDPKQPDPKQPDPQVAPTEKTPTAPKDDTTGIKTGDTASGWTTGPSEKGLSPSQAP